MSEQINNKAGRIGQRKKILKVIKIAIVIIILILLFMYFVVGLLYNSGNFSITLDKNLYFDDRIIIYDDPTYKVYRSELLAESIPTFDNISEQWLPDDVNSGEGSNNGENYLAYSFYLENLGEDTVDIWSEVVLTDVIKNVDEAVRIRVYKDNEYVTYAKVGATGEPERNAVNFLEDGVVTVDKLEDFGPGDLIKYTIVLWIEGSDPECTDNILGGEVKFNMNFNSEVVEN